MCYLSILSFHQVIVAKKISYVKKVLQVSYHNVIDVLSIQDYASLLMMKERYISIE